MRSWNAGHGAAQASRSGFSVGVAGLLFTLGALILPAMIGRAASRTTTGVLLFAPVAAGVVALLASFVSYALDLPLGPTAVGMLVLATPAALALRSGRGFLVRE